MKQQLRIGSNPITLQGTSFGRAYLLVQGVGAAPIADTDFSLQYLRTQIEISQAGVKDSTAFNAVGPFTRAINELNWNTFAAGSPFSSDIPSFNVSPDGQTLAGVYTDGTATSSVFYIPLLEGGYILKGDDYIRFNIDVLPTFFSSNVTAGSSVYLVTEEANGIVQADINIPVYEPITTDKQSPSFTYDAISEVAFLNAVECAGPNFNYGKDPLQAVDFRSQYVTEQFDIQTLYAKNLYQNSNPLTNSHAIYYVEPSALWDVQIGLAINTSQVIIGSQFLYVRKVLTGAALVQRAAMQEAKITKTSLRKRGVISK
ncbi:MAG: hypothetical protein RLZZ577_1642 [Bacteroidota bacterium]|jgi:hypothetical protein